MTKIRIPTESLALLEKELVSTLGDTIRQDIPARLGDPVSCAIYRDAITKTEIYVHGFGNDPSGVSVASANGLPKEYLVLGQPITIRLMDSGVYKFTGLYEQAGDLFNAGLTEENTQQPVYIDQLRYGTISPNGGLQVFVTAAPYGDNWVADIVADAFDGTALDTSAASIDVPTTNNRQIGVLVQMDASTGTLEYKQSAEFSASISRTGALVNGLLPTRDSTRNRIGYVFLKAGMSEIGQGDILNLPDFISDASSASVITTTQQITSTYTIPSGHAAYFIAPVEIVGTITVEGELIIL
jgi:hypothetical protein